MVEKSPAKVGLSKLVHDAYRFMMFHRNTLDEWPLQAYASALVFSPTNSIIRQMNEDHLNWIQVKPSMDKEWSANILNPEFRGSVQAVSFSPDGTLLASLGLGEIWISSTESGKLQRVIPTPLADTGGYPKHYIKFLPNNSLTVVHGARTPKNYVAYLWAATGELQRTFGPDSFRMDLEIALSLDGRIAFHKFEEDKIIVWNAFKDTNIEIRDGQTGCMKFSTNGRLAAVSNSGYSIKLWGQDGQLLQEINSWTYITDLAFSSDITSMRLAAMDDDGDLRVYSWTGAVYENFAHCVFSRDDVPSCFGFLGGTEPFLLCGSRSGLLSAWDCKITKELYTILAREDGIGQLAISTQGLIATISYDRRREYAKVVKIWDSLSFTIGSGQFETKTKQEGRVAISHDGKVVASTFNHQKAGKVLLWDGNTGAIQRTFEHNSSGTIHCLEFSPDDRYLVSTDWEYIGSTDVYARNLVTIYNREADKVRSLNQLNIGCPYSLEISANNRWLLQVGSDFFHLGKRTDVTMEIWDLNSKNMTIKHKISVPLNQCKSAISPDNGLVAISGFVTPVIHEARWQINIFDIQNGTLLHNIGVDHKPSAVAFYPKQSWLAWGDTKRTIRIWDIERRVVLKVFNTGGIDLHQLECIESSNGSPEERFTTNAAQLISKPGTDLLEVAPDSYSYGNSGWISFNDRNVLFFPRQFRPKFLERVKSQDSSLAVCSISGKMLYFRFSIDNNPLSMYLGS
jgi:WD40 repeat protein